MTQFRLRSRANVFGRHKWSIKLGGEPFIIEEFNRSLLHLDTTIQDRVRNTKELSDIIKKIAKFTLVLILTRSTIRKSINSYLTEILNTVLFSRVGYTLVAAEKRKQFFISA